MLGFSHLHPSSDLSDPNLTDHMLRVEVVFPSNRDRTSSGPKSHYRENLPTGLAEGWGIVGRQRFGRTTLIMTFDGPLLSRSWTRRWISPYPPAPRRVDIPFNPNIKI